MYNLFFELNKKVGRTQSFAQTINFRFKYVKIKIFKIIYFINKNTNKLTTIVQKNYEKYNR